MDLVDDVWGVNVLLVVGPVDGSELFGTCVLPVVVVEDAVELRVLLSRLISVSSVTESVQPLGGKLIV